MDNLEEMDKFLETYNLLRLNHKERIKKKVNESVTENLQHRKIQDQMVSLVNSTKYLKKINTNPFQILPKKEEKGTLPNPINQASITLIPKADKDTTRKYP